MSDRSAVPQKHPQGDSILETLDFGNEAGDDVSPAELVKYFVEQRNFRPYLDEKNRLLVATARKGVGKSALLKWIGHRVKQNDPGALVISIRGADLSAVTLICTAPLSVLAITHMTG